MRLMRWVRQLFWQWAPHTCRFVGAVNKHGECGAMCRRCGTAVWFNVKADTGNK